MSVQELLQQLKKLSKEAGAKADALEKFASIAQDLSDQDDFDPDGFQNAIDELYTNVDDFSACADELEALIENYEDALRKTASLVEMLINNFIYPEDFKKLFDDKETYL